MHPDRLTQRLTMRLPARGTRVSGEAGRPRDVLAASKTLLETGLAIHFLSAGAVACLAQCRGSRPHHGRAHQRLLAPGVLWQASICTARGLASGLVARAGSLACQASASVTQPEG